jgi:hypothetical protein
MLTFFSLVVFFMLCMLCGYYVYNKICMQEHKITTLFSIIQNIAVEVNEMKPNSAHDSPTDTDIKHIIITSEEVAPAKKDMDLIEVSSGEDTDSDSDTDTGSEESNSDTESHVDLEEVDNNEEMHFVQQSGNTILLFGTSPPRMYNSVSELEIIDDEEEEAKGPEEEEVKEPEEKLEEEKEPEMKIVNLEQDIKIDFKKLALPKLREIAIQRGLLTEGDALKMKKNDLIKLLSV